MCKGKIGNSGGIAPSHQVNKDDFQFGHNAVNRNMTGNQNIQQSNAQIKDKPSPMHFDQKQLDLDHSDLNSYSQVNNNNVNKISSMLDPKMIESQQKIYDQIKHDNANKIQKAPQKISNLNNNNNNNVNADLGVKLAGINVNSDLIKQQKELFNQFEQKNNKIQAQPNNQNISHLEQIEDESEDDDLEIEDLTPLGPNHLDYAKNLTTDQTGKVTGTLIIDGNDFGVSKEKGKALVLDIEKVEDDILNEMISEQPKPKEKQQPQNIQKHNKIEQELSANIKGIKLNSDQIKTVNSALREISQLNGNKTSDIASFRADFSNDLRQLGSNELNKQLDKLSSKEKNVPLISFYAIEAILNKGRSTGQIP